MEHYDPDELARMRDELERITKLDLSGMNDEDIIRNYRRVVGLTLFIAKGADLYALDRKKGNLLWQFSLEKAPTAADAPTPTMLQACTTFKPSRSASANTSSDSAPGLSQSSSHPLAAISGRTFKRICGGK